MTENNAIARLNSIRRMYREESETVKAIEMAIEALEKQIPKKPQTNVDRIRAMSDEELAEWVVNHDTKSQESGYWCKGQILQWLQTEAESEVSGNKHDGE